MGVPYGGTPESGIGEFGHRISTFGLGDSFLPFEAIWSPKQGPRGNRGDRIRKARGIRRLRRSTRSRRMDRRAQRPKFLCPPNGALPGSIRRNIRPSHPRGNSRAIPQGCRNPVALLRSRGREWDVLPVGGLEHHGCPAFRAHPNSPSILGLSSQAKETLGTKTGNRCLRLGGGPYPRTPNPIREGIDARCSSRQIPCGRQ